ncbi:MAG: FecCD family ABC transporter permease [Candidatus Kapaibacterium sp.]
MAVPLSRRRLTRKNFLPPFLGLSTLLLLLLPLTLSIGPELISPTEVLSTLLGRTDNILNTIIFDLRLPRIFLAIGVGGALAATGAVFQALLKNPLAEPYILGISNGCVVGTIVGINLPILAGMVGLSLSLGQVGITLLSFGGGALVTGIVLWIGRRGTGTGTDSLLLGGVMVAAIGAALIFLLLYFLPNVRGAIQWMLGDLSHVSPNIGYVSALFFLGLLSCSFFVGNSLNMIALGEEQAVSLGLNMRRATTIAYLGASLVVGIATSFCGAIGFIGLVVPHMIRRIVGPDHRLLMPLSVIAGGIFLLLCDTAARSLLPATGASGGELPVGAVTALVGAPLFIRLLTKERKG